MDLDYSHVPDQVKPKPPVNRDPVLYPEHVWGTACRHPWHRARFPLGPTCPTCAYARLELPGGRFVRVPPGFQPDQAEALVWCACGEPLDPSGLPCDRCDRRHPDTVRGGVR